MYIHFHKNLPSAEGLVLPYLLTTVSTSVFSIDEIVSVTYNLVDQTSTYSLNGVYDDINLLYLSYNLNSSGNAINFYLNISNMALYQSLVALQTPTPPSLQLSVLYNPTTSASSTSRTIHSQPSGRGRFIHPSARNRPTTASRLVPPPNVQPLKSPDFNQPFDA